MPLEAENEARKKAFADWCVDAEMMAQAQPDALFMHCLPAHRGEEVQADVIDGNKKRYLAATEQVRRMPVAEHVLKYAQKIVAATRTEAEFRTGASVRAGIALQAYIPDSARMQRTINEWARKRVARGGLPVTIRIVKGALNEAARVYKFKRGSGIAVNVPVFDLLEIGTGGGSIARIDALGLLKVGPRSAGASRRHRSMAWGQRGWKWQPEGGSSGEGISPLTGSNWRRLVSNRGTSASSARA